jgi:hypothetical protein
MTKGAYCLSDIDWPVVRLYCPQCHRHAQFKRSTLLDRFGPDKVMPSMLADLKPCRIGGGTSGPQCQLRFWDAMTDEARAEAIGMGGLPDDPEGQRGGLHRGGYAGGQHHHRDERCCRLAFDVRNKVRARRMILRVYSAEIIGLTFVPALLGVRTIGASRKVVAKNK